MQIEMNEIQIWSTNLVLTAQQAEKKYALLSRDEQKRVQRFYFPIHQRRFIAARSTLRTLLSLYLQVSAQEISFAYDEHKKPYLHGLKATDIQFNLSHSDDLAVFAFTRNHPIGVDVEKIKNKDHGAIAKRFFSNEEKTALLSLPVKEQLRVFYRIWSRKEAVLKAIGKGLSIPLSSFSVSLNDCNEMLYLGMNGTWMLLPLCIHPDFQSAVATDQHVKKLSYWKLFDQSAQLDKVTYF